MCTVMFRGGYEIWPSASGIACKTRLGTVLSFLQHFAVVNSYIYSFDRIDVGCCDGGPVVSVSVYWDGGPRFSPGYDSRVLVETKGKMHPCTVWCQHALKKTSWLSSSGAVHYGVPHSLSHFGTLNLITKKKCRCRKDAAISTANCLCTGNM